MDVANLISSRPQNATIGLFGEVTEDNDRIALVQVRPGMREGQREALMLRRWGMGQGCRADGQTWHYNEREDAIEVAKRWVSEGRTCAPEVFQ